MTAIKYSLMQMEDDTFITVVIPGHDQPYAANQDHPAFQQIIDAVTPPAAPTAEDDGDTIAALFSPADAIKTRLAISDRVSVTSSAVFWDGDPLDNALTEKILRFYSEGVEDWQPLVEFLERVMTNPNDDSREQFYRWIASHDLTITDDGKVIAYKGVRSDSEGNYVSVRSGPGIVNGEEFTDAHLRNNPGDVVEMPRSQVRHDPNQHCSVGLHVATHNYASTWTSVDAVLEVEVDPRDIVSVPNDHGGEKVRCCRYTVIGTVTAPYTTPVRANTYA